MRIKYGFEAIVIAILLTFVALPGVAVGQESKSLVASANGEGTIKLGNESFKIHSVVVKLFEDGKAEINLVTDITVFISGTWSRESDAGKVINLKITGTSMSEGGGTLLLTEDRKSIASLNLKTQNKVSKKTVSANFVAK